MIKFKDVFNKLSKNKKNLVLALCSVLALVLLLVSEFASDDKLDSSEKVNSYVSSENYIKEQEENEKLNYGQNDSFDISAELKKSEQKKSSDLTAYMAEHNLKTVGCAFYHLEQNNIRIRDSKYQAVRSQYKEEIEDDIPEGLIFLPEHEINKQYEWKMYDKDGELTDSLEEVKRLNEIKSECNILIEHL